MAIGAVFNNRVVKLPGAYSTITSGETNTFRDLDYGRCLLIDTGELGKTWGGGSGVDGTALKGKDAVYRFSSLDDFRFFVKGGMLWQLGQALFLPDRTNPAAVGISELYYVRAATTTPATMTFTSATGGTFKFKTKDEGLNANGVLDTAKNLTKGYGFTFIKGRRDATKFILQVWRGSFTGLHTDGLPYNEIFAEKSKPILIVESPETDNIKDLQNWAKSDKNFNSYLYFDTTSSVIGQGTFTAEEVKAVTDKGYEIAASGTETYDASGITAALKALEDIDVNFVVTDRFGNDKGADATVKQIIGQVTGQDKFKKIVFVGLGETESDFVTSITNAGELNNQFVAAVHGEVGMPSTLAPDGFRWWGVGYNTCSQLGRTAGLPPYIPVTNKSIGVSQLRHRLTTTQKEDALDAGLLVTTFNGATKRNVVLQGINTLQDNEVLFNANGESFQIQFVRIVEQLNRELVINSEIDLLSVENGVNSNTLNPGVLKSWTESYLQTKVSTDTQDNLLLSFRNVIVKKRGDIYDVTYEIVVNNEINKIFFTGFLFSR